MSPSDVLALAIGGAVAFYAGYRAIGWLADRIIDTASYLTRFEDR